MMRKVDRGGTWSWESSIPPTISCRRFRRRFALILVIACAAFLSTAFLPWQSAVSPSLTPGFNQTQSSAGKIIRVDVSLVTVPVMVTDKSGNHVPGLRAGNFRIFEDGAAQQIDRLFPEAEPFHVGMMLDSSGSTRLQYSDIQKAALAFAKALRPQDRLMIISFDTSVSYHSGFTADRDRIGAAIMETGTTNQKTGLYDAIDRVLSDQFDRLPGRKAIVLFSDGVDNASERMERGATLSRIERSDVVVYAVQYDTRDGTPDRYPLPAAQTPVAFNTLYKRAVKFLGDLSKRSGGCRYQAGSIDTLNAAFSQIASELPLQYTLCYYPARVSRAGSYHRIRVTVDRPGVKVRSRTGYRAGYPTPEARCP